MNFFGNENNRIEILKWAYLAAGSLAITLESKGFRGKRGIINTPPKRNIPRFVVCAWQSLPMRHWYATGSQTIHPI